MKSNNNKLYATVYESVSITVCSELRKVLFLALSVTILFAYEISLEPVNGFAPNSHGRRVGPSLGRV